jgi:hypothetical protein
VSDETDNHFNFQEKEEDKVENDNSQLQEVEVLEKISTENDDFTLINWSEDFEEMKFEDETVESEEDKNSNLRDYSSDISEEKEYLFQEFSENRNKDDFGAFGGMISRSREVPKKYSQLDEIATQEYIATRVNLVEENMASDTLTSQKFKGNNNYYEQRNLDNHEDKLVFDTEGEVWTVDKKNEQTLPKKSHSFEELIFQDSTLQEPAFVESKFETITPENHPIKSNFNDEVEYVDQKSSPIKSKITLSPKWDDDEPFNSEYASHLSDTEILIISKAIEREISPSDSELQALLQVGRPRLSQIYNGLNKAGILSVRKKGRSRLFKISESAKSYF